MEASRRLEICQRFQRIYNGAIADVLDELGYKTQALPKELRPLTPEMSIHGFALTAYGRPSRVQDMDAVIVPLLKMLGEVKPGDVIVNQARDNVCAHFGELCATAAKARGGHGAVIYGGVRDVDYIIRLGFPVFCCYTTPVDVVGRWELEGYNVPVEIAGVRIEPGDFISADKDGVLVIPKGIVEEVLAKAEELVATENKVRDAIVEGCHPLDAYYRYGRF